MEIKQSTQLKNMLDRLRGDGVNVVSSVDGIIIASAHVGIILEKPAKNRVHVRALSSDERIPPIEQDFDHGISEAIDCCARLVALDKSGKLK